MNEKGISLIESLLALAVIGSIVFLLASLPNAFTLYNKSRHFSLAREIVIKQIEDKRAVSFQNLANDSSSISDTRLGILPQSSGTIVIENCPAAVCAASLEIKQITAQVQWFENGKDQTVTLKTLIGQGGINQ